MPTYDYQCPECNHSESHFHKMNDHLNFSCHRCFDMGKNNQMKKGIGGGLAVHFKGSGFYETDYKGKTKT